MFARVWTRRLCSLGRRAQFFGSKKQTENFYLKWQRLVNPALSNWWPKQRKKAWTEGSSDPHPSARGRSSVWSPLTLRFSRRKTKDSRARWDSVALSKCWISQSDGASLATCHQSASLKPALSAHSSASSERQPCTEGGPPNETGMGSDLETLINTGISFLTKMK